MKGLRGERSMMMRGGLPSGRGTVKILDWKQGCGGTGYTTPFSTQSRTGVSKSGRD